MATNTAENITKHPLYVFDLPRKLLQTLEPQFTGTQNIHTEEEDAVQDFQNQSISAENEISKTAACALCNLSFSNTQDQRTHVRSDLHRYNLKQQMRGLKPVSDTEFDRLIGDLDESISGSDSPPSSDSESDEGDGKAPDNSSKLSTLLKRQANVQEEAAANALSRKRQRGSGKPPLLWFKTPSLPTNTTLGIYRALFSPSEQSSESNLVPSLQCKQLEPQQPPKATAPPRNPPDGGVALPAEPPAPTSIPHVFLCMIGGGHFAGMVVSLAPKVTKNHNTVDARQATVLAHKTFHRYTTRRKQGGAQSANDNSKGNAHSAGASIRRYNEEALVNDVRGLLREWKSLIDTSDLLFLRATGSTNRSTLFGLAKEEPNWPLRPNDERLRGFPFSTRRATEAELMRCFVELTRVKVKVVDEEAERRAAAEAEEKATRRKQEEEARLAHKKEENDKKAAANAQEQEALLHTGQLTALIRRNKAPAVLSYLTTNGLDSSYQFYPPENPAYYHAPTPLHFAASNNAAAVVTALLVKGGADPAIFNAEELAPFDMAGDRATRDAFCVARSEVGENKWDWKKAHVPAALSREEVTRRAEQAKKEEQEEEAARRQQGLDKLKEEEVRKEEERRQRGNGGKLGKSRTLATAAGQRTAQERREEEGRGMTPEMKMRMEREKRARAVEERMKRMQGQG